MFRRGFRTSLQLWMEFFTIRDHVMQFLSSNRLIKRSQFGFLPGRSSELQLIEFLDRISVVLDQGDSADIVYLDFKKPLTRYPTNVC